MADLPSFDGLSKAQVSLILNSFKPHEGASNDEAIAEYKRWLRGKLLAEVQRRLYFKLHADLAPQEQEIIKKVQGLLPDPDAAPET